MLAGGVICWSARLGLVGRRARGALWCLSPYISKRDLPRTDDSGPLAGTKTIKYLEENVGALKVKLTSKEVEELESLVPRDEVRVGHSPAGASLMGVTKPLSTRSLQL